MVNQKLVYTPRLEQIHSYPNGDCVQSAWQDWGIFDTEQEAMECIPQIIEDVKLGRYRHSTGNHFAAVIEVDIDDPDLWGIAEIIEVIDKIEE